MLKAIAVCVEICVAIGSLQGAAGSDASLAASMLHRIGPLLGEQVSPGRKVRNGRIESLSINPDRINFQFRNPKPNGASGLIGNFYIMNDSLLIYEDSDPPRLIETVRLARLRRRLLGIRSNQYR